MHEATKPSRGIELAANVRGLTRQLTEYTGISPELLTALDAALDVLGVDVDETIYPAGRIAPISTSIS